VCGTGGERAFTTVVVVAVTLSDRDYCRMTYAQLAVEGTNNSLTLLTILAVSIIGVVSSNFNFTFLCAKKELAILLMNLWSFEEIFEERILDHILLSKT